MATSPPALSRADFLAKAQPLQVTVGGNTFAAEPREFKTGSYGWYLSAKTTVTVDGKPLQVQIGLNLTVIGSKDAGR